MNKIRASIIIISCLMLSSCSLPETFWLLNNTPYEISLSDKYEELIKIKAGKSNEANILTTTFSIKSEKVSYKYIVELPPQSFIKWTGWGYWSKRMIYLQLEPDGKIWLLSDKTKVPNKVFIKQPDGFPLEPST